MFGGRGDVEADGAEVLGSGHGACAVEDFLPDFDHADSRSATLLSKGMAISVANVM